MWTRLDAAIVGFFNPLAADPAARASVRNEWPLQRLDHAVYIAVIYVAFVVGCKLTLDKGVKTTASSEKKTMTSVAEKIKQEGLLIFVSMAVYNATQVLLCGWMVYAALAEHWRRGLGLVCNEHDLAQDGMAFVLHVFYFSKVLDFADTVFMIVKRNWRQVSFLHVYHHTSIFLIYWLNSQTNYDSDIYFTIVLNGAIHFIMYGYYLATSFNVVVPTFIKKSITNAQLIQFCCMELQGACLLFGDCGSPRNVTILYMVYISTMLVLFLDFKRRTYSSAKPKAGKVSEIEPVICCGYGIHKTTARPNSVDDSSDLDDASTVASEHEIMSCCGWVVDRPAKVHRVMEDAGEQASERAATAVASARIAAQDAVQGATEVLLDGKLYDVDRFKHPGGTIIKFFMGSGDATASFEQFHIRSKKAIKVLATLPSRPAPAGTVASAAGGKEKLAADFQKLTADLKAEGFFTPSMGAIVYRLSELVALFVLGIWLLRSDSSVLRVTSILVLGVAEGRCGWLMHEGGHNSLTGNIKIDRALQVWTYGLGCGMSGGWWRSQHNKHHAAPQKLKHDADLDTLPLVAFNAACVRGVRSLALRTWLQAQAYLFMPLTCFLVVLGWQLFLHPRYIVRSSKWSEVPPLLIRYCATFFFVLSGIPWPSAFTYYLLVQQAAGCYIFTNFALSHTHLDVTQSDEHIHWCEYASSHTTNLSNHWFVNWWMAYLNFQIEHHLFPAMPQFRHPEVSIRVRALFQKHGIAYDVRGYFACLGDTLKNLNEVGNSTGSKPQSRKDQ
jgi:fatty acid desaturase/cytochrome b involved in lipid metabolism